MLIWFYSGTRIAREVRQNKWVRIRRGIYSWLASPRSEMVKNTGNMEPVTTEIHVPGTTLCRTGRNHH